MTKPKLEIPPVPTPEQLREALNLGFTNSPESRQLTTDVCRLLQASPEAMSIIRGFIKRLPSGDNVTLAGAGSLFTAGFMTGYLVAFGMMKLKEN